MITAITWVAASGAILTSGLSVYWSKRMWQSLALAERYRAEAARFRRHPADVARHEALAARNDRRAWPLKARPIA